MEKKYSGKYSKREKRGFTLAELLITVAIISVLGGVAFIMVMRYMRSMAQLERDGIAKEIFVAAQNHLTMAESQGYLQFTEYGNKESGTGGSSGSSGGAAGDSASSGTADDSSAVWYFVVNGSGSFSGNTLLDLMLPFGSVDETVRLSGSYIVRYQAQPARVLDVYYCTPDGTRFGHTLREADYTSVIATGTPDQKKERRTFGDDRAVLGWYGGEEALTLQKGDPLSEPLIEVINGNRLLVKVTDTNTGNPKASLKLIITGETSGEKAAFTLSSALGENITYDLTGSADGGVYTVTLDDITEDGLHFSELFENFIPGENITVQAVAYNNQELTNIGYSTMKTTNSLFADIRAAGSGAEAGSSSGSSGDGGGTGTGLTGEVTASVSSLRHLENLANNISNVNAAGSLIQVTGAVQTTDLDWNDFVQSIVNGKNEENPSSGSTVSSIRVFTSDTYAGTAATGSTKENCYLPVSPEYALSYDGQGHSISQIRTDYSGDAGLFGTLEEGSAVSNLMLVDFDITTTDGNAGALVGSASGTDIFNVVARAGTSASAASSSGTVVVSGGAGHAGGLAGTMDGGSVRVSAAALVVKNSGAGDAGGLIGSVSPSSGSASVTACYSGGRTVDGKYSTDADAFNVIAASGKAGGLIGSVSGSVSIESSYSTCSAAGASAAGGFVGTAGSGTGITKCYATGLVRGSGDDGTENAGAFAGTLEGSADACSYFEVINQIVLTEPQESSGGTDDPAEGNMVMILTAIGNGGTKDGITPFDADTDHFNDFVRKSGDAAPADPYDSTLILYYEGYYEFPAVTMLYSADDMDDTSIFVSTHFGDWPSPEILFMNKK